MQKIGIGYENYKRLIDDGCYYVDKTLLIRDVMLQGGMVTLFTRPRRFGKTLALSMLRTFFEAEYDRDGNRIDKQRYFEGKKIMEAGEDILCHMGQYPVISLSLKSAKRPTFFGAFVKLRDDIYEEIIRHDYLKDSERLSPEDMALFDELKKRETLEELADPEKFSREIDRYATALRTLSILLKKHHGRNCIILLDEYDVPLENAYYNGFYDEMISFIRSLFESALKTNDSLERAVITGCLRISKESIFTGMNNLEINSVRDAGFSEGFGFTDPEVEDFFKDYGIEEKLPEARDWYDGYTFGETEIYNPWSITKYVKGIVIDKKKYPEPYWANTSSNLIIKDMVITQMTI